MSDDPEDDEAAVGPDELEAAARLTAAVDGPPGPGVDAEALAAVYLLQAAALGEAPDDLAEARLRRRLHRLAGRRAAIRVAAVTAAAAASVVVGVALHRPSRPDATAALVEQREREARRAVTALVSSRSLDDPVRPLVIAERRDELVAAIRGDRFEALRWSALARVAEPESWPQTTGEPLPTPTEPGGRES